MAEVWGKETSKWTKLTDENEVDTVGIKTDQCNHKRLRTDTTIVGYDTLAAEREAQVIVRTDGVKALAVDSRTIVESTFGFDQQPDSYFRIVNTGGAGTTWTIDIAGTSNDPSSPDRDVPAYQKIFTVQVSEEGDELAFRDRIIQELNADSVFRQTCFFKSQNATDRAIVHIYSEAFSASGEFYERPNPGDFDITIGGTPGDGVVVIGFDNIISRSKPVTISRDLDSPHRLGLFGITGSVNVTAKELSDIFVQDATDDGLVTGSNDMTVNGSVTPVDFTIPAQVDKEIFIEELIFDGQGNGIKFGNFLSRNAALTNGVEVTIKSDNIETVFPVIFATEDFKNKWSALGGNGGDFRIDVQAGADEMLAILSFPNPFILRSQGTFTIDDFIRVRIRDNLTNNPNRFNFRAKGFEKEP